VKKLLDSLEKSDLDGYEASVKALYGLRQRDRVQAKNYTGGRASKVPPEKARTRIRVTGKREIKNSLSRRDIHNQKIIGDSIGKLHDALVQRGKAGKRTLEMSQKLAGDIPRWSQRQIDRNTKVSEQLALRIGREKPVSVPIGKRPLPRKARVRSPLNPFGGPANRSLNSTRGGAKPMAPEQKIEAVKPDLTADIEAALAKLVRAAEGNSDPGSPRDM
jgi:hypothetical protein